MASDINIRSEAIELIEIGKLRARYSAAGDRILRYYIDFRHHALNLYKELSATELSALQVKVDTLMIDWDRRYKRFLEKEHLAASREQAAEMTLDAEMRRDRLRATLIATLDVNDAVDWDSLKDKSEFVAQPFDERPPRGVILPARPIPPKIGFIQSLFGQKARLVAEYKSALAKYQKEKEARAAAYFEKREAWERRKKEWEEKQAALERDFLSSQEQENAKIDKLRQLWENGDPQAILEHAGMVLDSSDHDACIPKQFRLDYNEDTQTLLVEYQLPTPDDLPLTKSVRFVAQTGALRKTNISMRDKKSLYDDLCYQLCLRTIHELFEADIHKNIANIGFNGITNIVNRATGQSEQATILSILTSRNDFEVIDLAHVDPKACFKSLKGVGATSLAGLTPIAPVVEFNLDDDRFVAGHEINQTDIESVNLAAMDWEDFEHLVRDLFEREFSSTGGEVKVTRASRDGGVDAIAFDPDPIRGGKIVIQAKRYTRTVGVSAVRDLYGTVMNEGAIKGILVTTADFGPDAHRFASDKPLTLLSGSHLLHLLEKHGTKARIDLGQARKELGLQ